MKAPHQKSPLKQRSDLSANGLLTLLLVISMAAFTLLNFVAKASALSGEDGSNQVTATTDGAGVPQTDAVDYRLAPGDLLTIVVLDQPQLSGDFCIDGGGSVLLPLAGSARVAGLTLAQAQDVIRERFADGVIVQPGVSVRLTKFRPIFVTGSVRKPGSYPFDLGESVKAAIATAGGQGPAIEQPLSAATSDYITAAQHLRQLEADHAVLLMRKARLEAQRDGRENFAMPLLVGLSKRNIDLDHAYSAENDIFLRFSDNYRQQVRTLENQRPLIKAELDAVNGQIAKQQEHLDIVKVHLADLETLFSKGLLRKDVFLEQQIEKTLVEAQLSNLQAQVAHLRQAMGDIDIRLEDVKANYERQTLVELQETSQRLSETENSIGPARKTLKVRAEAATNDSDDADYAIFISRPRDGRVVTFEVSDDATLSPGDVVEVKLKRHDTEDGSSADGSSASIDGSSASTQAELSAEPISSVAEGSQAESQ